MTRLGQQEETNLRDVGPGRDVNEVILFLGIERICAREVMERAEDLVEVPGVANFNLVGPHFSFGRDAPNVVAGSLDKTGIPALMEKLETIDQELFVLAKGNCGAPSIPSFGAVSGVQIRTDEPDYNGWHH